tara:strand:+ start:395 stop:550 length:156 start_codon:yes stop_codon:yes gene_type:complete
MKNLTQIEDLSGATNANYNSNLAGLAQSGTPTKEEIAREAAKQLLQTNQNM